MSLVLENKLSYLILFGDVFIKMYTETPKLLYMVWYGNSLFDTTYKYTHLNILHN